MHVFMMGKLDAELGSFSSNHFIDNQMAKLNPAFEIEGAYFLGMTFTGIKFEKIKKTDRKDVSNF